MKKKRKLPEVVWHYDIANDIIVKLFQSKDWITAYENSFISYTLEGEYLYRNYFRNNGCRSTQEFKWFNSIEECKKYRLVELKKMSDEIYQKMESESKVFE